MECCVTAATLTLQRITGCVTVSFAFMRDVVSHNVDVRTIFICVECDYNSNAQATTIETTTTPQQRQEQHLLQKIAGNHARDARTMSMMTDDLCDRDRHYYKVCYCYDTLLNLK